MDSTLWAAPKTKNATPDIGPEWRFVQIIRPRAVLRGPESGGNREKNLEHKAQFLQPGADTILRAEGGCAAYFEALENLRSRAESLQIPEAVAEAAAAVRGEGHNGLSGKGILPKESEEHHGHGAPPTGIADKDSIEGIQIRDGFGVSGAGVGSLFLLGYFHDIVITFGIGPGCLQLEDIAAHLCMNFLGHGSGIAAAGIIEHKNFTPAAGVSGHGIQGREGQGAEAGCGSRQKRTSGKTAIIRKQIFHGFLLRKKLPRSDTGRAAAVRILLMGMDRLLLQKAEEREAPGMNVRRKLSGRSAAGMGKSCPVFYDEAPKAKSAPLGASGKTVFP